MEEKGCDENTAMLAVVAEAPELIAEHIYTLAEITKELAEGLGFKGAVEAVAKAPSLLGCRAMAATLKAHAESVQENPEFHPFCLQARAVAKAEGIDFVEATQRVAAKNHASYASYQALFRRR